ncbi:MAG: molybdenum cofactor biosynthesis protein A [Methanoregula sp. PtaU1.Bin051]|nr:MAG: molybdenum cofactor biosynthesis protein A [Methanoregula sp. PtaU1.Bin051]
MTHIRITEDSGIPLLGSLYFGIIDRGTSLLQVRPSCGCNLNCPFCSVDAGPASRTRATSYEVSRDYIVSYVKEIARFKGDGVECHIDSPGEPMLYKELSGLIADLRAIHEVVTVSMQTNGTLLTADTIRSLESAGLDRINLSLHAIDPDLARQLSGVPWFDVTRVINAAREIAKSRIDLLIAPVFLPGINDAEIPRIIQFAREIGAGRRFPALGIQKFERYRYGRTPRGIKVQSWWQFYNRSLKPWEKEYNFRLIIRPQDFGTVRRPMVKKCFEKGEKTTVEIRAPGWLNGEMIGVAKDRVVSVLNCDREKGNVRVKIVSAKHGIYIAVPA